MNRNVKTTRIEKKYKDKNGNERTLQIDFAKAADRIKQFREDCPNGLIETTPSELSGKIMFKAFVKKDKSKSESAEATGHALATKVGEKEFEKLETISIARALAILGYLASGEIASSEEMEEFYDYQSQKIQDAINSINATTTLDQLKEVFIGLGGLIAEKKVVEAKDKKKAELS